MNNTAHILWFFSTCAQTFAALVSVFGMFVLYRLQIEEGRIGAMRDRMLRFDELHFKMPIEAILKNLKNKEEESRLSGELDHSKTIRTLINDYAGAIGKRAWLSRHARHPMIWLILLTFWSLAGLVFYPYYANSSVGTFLIGLTLAVCVLPLYQVGSIITASITLD
jgi:hypothetical protein